MKIYINGETTTLPKTSTKMSIQQVLAIVLADNEQTQSFALALNGEFVGRDHYHATQVSNHDRIDLLFPIVGG
ncbi:sulfur carrier protein [Colwellia chukchiensis]|uniref:Sulfur carrier protein n=1 Tax=Colwellia chukchiensis TaxID=641665 RepID=A0A1H7I169_9GAMM|nr:sulfur carrier protein ThiS [Colwellia chukchiensis]SEK54235.1 sulfur carrier protein [Colwellia chukchiensis]